MKIVIIDDSWCLIVILNGYVFIVKILEQLKHVFVFQRGLYRSFEVSTILETKVEIKNAEN